MATPRRLVTIQQLLICRIEEEYFGGDSHLVKSVKLTSQLGEELLGAQIADNGKLSRGADVKASETHEVKKQRRRQIVNAEVTKVLEGMHGLGAARTRHTGNDDEVGTKHRRAGLFDNVLLSHETPLY